MVVNQEIGSVLPLVGDFQDFAVGSLGNGIGRGGGKPRIAESGHDLIPLCEQRVPGKDGFGDAEDLVRGRAAPAHLRIVHDVVMEQGRHMEHLHRRGKGIDVVIGIAEQTGHEYGQQGPQPFPSVPHGVLGDGHDGDGEFGGRLGQRRVDAGLFLFDKGTECDHGQMRIKLVAEDAVPSRIRST